jgi:serine-type D-Ala-D-Ala carboxypeptidase/endopeptidase
MSLNNSMNLPLQNLISRDVAPLLKNGKSVGVSVALITPDQIFTLNQGRFNPASDVPPSSHTLFKIGSVTKLFTATLLASLVHQGKLDLQAPVASLLPELSKLAPDITLLRLATHTSGLPHLPANLYRSRSRNGRNPYAAHTFDELYTYLSKFEVAPRTLGRVNYSSLGMGLLGHVLERTLGMSYEQAIATYICDPLGLSDTCITLTAEQQQYFIQGYFPNHKPASPWDLPTLAGADAMHSTAHDLSTFLQANLNCPQTSLATAIATCHQIHAAALGASNLLGVGLGWLVNRLNYATGSATVYWHNGATGGYQAYVGFIKKLHVGVVVLANQGLGWQTQLFRQSTVNEIGLNLLKLLADHYSEASEAESEQRIIAV